MLFVHEVPIGTIPNATLYHWYHGTVVLEYHIMVPIGTRVPWSTCSIMVHVYVLEYHGMVSTGWYRYGIPVVPLLLLGDVIMTSFAADRKIKTVAFSRDQGCHKGIAQYHYRYVHVYHMVWWSGGFVTAAASTSYSNDGQSSRKFCVALLQYHLAIAIHTRYTCTQYGKPALRERFSSVRVTTTVRYHW
jgi:hypothetical protein